MLKTKRALTWCIKSPPGGESCHSKLSFLKKIFFPTYNQFFTWANPKATSGEGQPSEKSAIVSPWLFIILESWRIPSILLQQKVTQVTFPSQNQTQERSHHTECSIGGRWGALPGFPAAEVLLPKGKHPLQSLEFCPVSWFTYWLITILRNFKHHQLSVSPGSLNHSTLTSVLSFQRQLVAYNYFSFPLNVAGSIL